MKHAYAVEHVCWRVQAADSFHRVQEQHVQHSSAVTPSVQGTRRPPQTEPSGIEHESTGTAADRHRNASHLNHKSATKIRYSKVTPTS